MMMLPWWFLYETKQGKLPKTNSSPLKRGRKPKGKEVVFQPSIFRCYVIFREGNVYVYYGKKNTNNYEQKPIPYHPCMGYLPIFTRKNQPNVGKYTIHGWYGNDSKCKAS